MLIFLHVATDPLEDIILNSFLWYHQSENILLLFRDQRAYSTLLWYGKVSVWNPFWSRDLELDFLWEPIRSTGAKKCFKNYFCTPNDIYTTGSPWFEGSTQWLCHSLLFQMFLLQQVFVSFFLKKKNKSQEVVVSLFLPSKTFISPDSWKGTRVHTNERENISD